MFRKTLILIATLTALAIVTGCNGTDDVVTGGPTGGDSVAASQIADAAMESDLLTEQVLDAELASMEASMAPSTREGEGGSGIITQDVTFSLSRSCPLGGTVAIQGSAHRTFDPATHEMEAEFEGSRSATDCMFAREDLTITVNGSTNWDAFRRRVEGYPDGPQTTHYSGSWAVERSDGEEWSCEFEIAIVRDPSTHTRTLDGVICGTEVHRSVTWTAGE
jgi:hypothetical protein